MSHRDSDLVPCVDSPGAPMSDSENESALFGLHPILAKYQHVFHHVEQGGHLAIWLVHHLRQHRLVFWIDDRYLARWWFHWVYGADKIHHFRVSITSSKLNKLGRTQWVPNERTALVNSMAKYKWTVMKLDGLLAFQGIPKKMVMSDSSLKYMFAIAKRRRLKFSP